LLGADLMHFTTCQYKPLRPGWIADLIMEDSTTKIPEGRPKKGAGTVVRSTLRAVPATVPDPFLGRKVANSS